MVFEGKHKETNFRSALIRSDEALMFGLALAGGWRFGGVKTQINFGFFLLFILMKFIFRGVFLEENNPGCAVFLLFL